MFHWTPARPIEECIIVGLCIKWRKIFTQNYFQDKKEAAMTVLNGHVVVSIEERESTTHVCCSGLLSLFSFNFSLISTVNTLERFVCLPMLTLHWLDWGTWWCRSELQTFTSTSWSMWWLLERWIIFGGNWTSRIVNWWFSAKCSLKTICYFEQAQQMMLTTENSVSKFI